MNDRPRRRDFDGRPPRRDGGHHRPQRDGGRRYDRDDRAPRRDGKYGRNDDRPQRDGERRFDRDDRRPRREDDRRPRREDDRRPRRGSQRDDGSSPRGGDRVGRGGTRGGGRSDRGGRDREYSEAERLQHELRPVRAEHDDPEIPDDVQAKDLHPAARKELKQLQVELQDRVARHLAMVAVLIDDDPELAHQHAISASRRAGRIPVTRETLAITAYRTGDFALALRELRTYRRLTGSSDHLALMVDCERGLGRPEKAIQTGLEADTENLDTEQRVQLAIAMSGARLDLGQTQQALYELEIPELNPKRAYSWSPELFRAYAAVLQDLGRDAEGATWSARADEAERALQEHYGVMDELEVFEIVEERELAVEEAPARSGEDGEEKGE